MNDNLTDLSLVLEGLHIIMSLKERAIVLLIRYYNLLNWLFSRMFGYSLRNGRTSGEEDRFDMGAHRHKILFRSVWGVEEEAQVLKEKLFLKMYSTLDISFHTTISCSDSTG